MPLSAEDKGRYDNLAALNQRMAAKYAGGPAPTPGIAAPPAPPAPQELQPYINDTGFRGARDMRGGFVGAATDAQAERAMQDRATQSQYAQQNIAQMNRGADAMRDLRATRLGIDRSVLDQMEGRAGNYAAPANGIAASGGAGNFDPFARPGDSYGDSQMRAQNYESMLKQAATGTGITAKQRSALAESAQGLLAPGALIGQQGQAAADLASRERIAGMGQQAGIARATLDAQADLARQQFDQRNQDRQFGLDVARFNLDANSKRAPLSPYETELQQARAKQEVGQEQKQRTGASDLQDLLAKTDRLYALSANTGLFAPLQAAIARPFGGERSAQAEEFKSLSNSLAAALVKQLPGPLSEKELQFIKDQTVQLGNTPEGNRKILDNLRSFALQNAARNGVDIKSLVDQRGATLEAQGVPRDQIIETLRREFAGAY